MENLFQTKYRAAAVYSLAALHADRRVFHQRQAVIRVAFERTILSQKNGWESENGNVYVSIRSSRWRNDLDRSERTVKTLCGNWKRRADEPASVKAGIKQTVYSCKSRMGCSFLPVQREIIARWMADIFTLHGAGIAHK